MIYIITYTYNILFLLGISSNTKTSEKNHLLCFSEITKALSPEKFYNHRLLSSYNLLFYSENTFYCLCVYASSITYICV